MVATNFWNWCASYELPFEPRNYSLMSMQSVFHCKTRKLSTVCETKPTKSWSLQVVHRVQLIGCHCNVFRLSMQSKSHSSSRPFTFVAFIQKLIRSHVSKIYDLLFILSILWKFDIRGTFVFVFWHNDNWRPEIFSNSLVQWSIFCITKH